ncbi:AraC family transcriptional regulator [Brevibacterium aurantiacum]|uniref:AraC family transcriptional regulator n=1 Tax=Brevibacterium aurantiacum TaxID=273384 RepID=UPI001865C80E|nr:helix-turn-helix domain-containing protein [Brevibacterium aurantiacum]
MNDTHRLAPHDRRRHWETWNFEALTPLDVFSPSPDGPIVSSNQRAIDGVKFTVLRGASHAVQHDAEHIASKPQDSIFATIILVGEGFFYSSSLTTTFCAGDAVIYPVSQPYLIAFTEEMVQITVDVPSAQLERWEIAAAGRAPHLTTLTKEMTSTAARLPRLLAEADEEEAAGALALIRGVLQTPQEHSEAARIFSAGEHLISLNYARPDFDVAALAGSLNISERQLRRVFRSYGRTPGRRLRDVRLDAARGLIVSTSRPLKTVAAATGFVSGESLTRAYRSRFGTTPSEDRE